MPVPNFGDPFVLLDDARGGIAPRLFRHPHEVVTATSLAEVLPALDRVREGIGQGRYAAGYLAYEAGFAFEHRLARLNSSETTSPLLWFGLFDAPETGMIPPQEGLFSQHEARLIPDINACRHRRDVERVLELVRAGDCYQINYTFGGRLPHPGDLLQLYRRLRSAQRAGWGGVLSTGERTLLSCSPELFFSLESGRVWTKPMKGTAARGGSPAEDEACKSHLGSDAKERAENLMIVDLLRNDLSRASTAGSVEVPELFAIETYPTVHQMTSSVTARLVPGLDAVDVIKRLFPCGSVTGAPKIRAMEIIAELENRQRGAYTGAMGFIAPDGSAAFNVLIRTLEYVTGDAGLNFSVGSGIVADSSPHAEWRECHAKAEFLRRASDEATP